MGATTAGRRVTRSNDDDKGHGRKRVHEDAVRSWIRGACKLPISNLPISIWCRSDLRHIFEHSTNAVQAVLPIECEVRERTSTGARPSSSAPRKHINYLRLDRLVAYNHHIYHRLILNVRPFAELVSRVTHYRDTIIVIRKVKFWTGLLSHT